MVEEDPFGGQRPWVQTVQYLCVSPSGRASAEHLPSKDGHCLRCGQYDEVAERPIGEGL
jgi:hypothetical protein